MYRTMTGTAALILMGLAACAPERSDRGLISEPSFSHLGEEFGTGCSLRTARTLAQSYFNNADRLTAWNLIKNMVEVHGAAANNDHGYNLFRLIADARDNGRVAGTPQNGGDLTIALSLCMAVTVTDRTDFRNVLTGALTTGAYAVRGGAGDPEAAVITANGESGTNPDGETTWNEFLNGRALVYGAEVESAFTEEELGQSYRWGLVFDGGGPNPEAGDDQVVVAFCTEFDLPEAARVGRKSSTTGGQTVLQLAQNPTWLPCGDVASANPGGFLARVLALLLPQPVQASSAFFFSNTGGLAGGFSDFTVVDPGAVVLTWVTQPTNGFVNTDIPVAVRATAAGGTPLEHVGITLTIEGNQGWGALTGGGQVDTGEDGVASFTISIDKAGGYTLRATASFAGFNDPPVFILSNLFNLQNK